jgi:hypothetical protein
MPNGNPPATSVFRVNDLQDDEIWMLGEARLELGPGRRLHGAALFESSATPRPLIIEMNENPERHGNIEGWPQEMHEQQILAIELASKSTLKLRL